MLGIQTRLSTKTHTHTLFVYMVQHEVTTLNFVFCIFCCCCMCHSGDLLPLGLIADTCMRFFETEKKLLYLDTKIKKLQF